MERLGDVWKHGEVGRVWLQRAGPTAVVQLPSSLQAGLRPWDG